MEFHNKFNGIEPGNRLPAYQTSFRIAPYGRAIFSKPEFCNIDYIGKINNDFVFKAISEPSIHCGYFCIATNIRHPNQMWIPKLYPDIYSALCNTITSILNRDIIRVTTGEYINKTR